jgi:catalase
VEELRAQAVEAIGVLNQRDGRHAGCRAAHAKGTVCHGVFHATPQARELTAAAHMRGEPVEVTVRFSNGSGDPMSPDFDRSERGMATGFHLAGGSRTDILAVNLPCFVASTPTEFIDFTRTTIPSSRTGRPGLLKIGAYVLTHWRSLRPLYAHATSKRIPSYANCRYNALHAFKWKSPAGIERYVRYSWLPDEGEASISATEARRRGGDYLQQELVARLSGERVRPIAFTLAVQIAGERDPVDDATRIWPARRETVAVGHLLIDRLETDLERGGNVLFFDPTSLTEGIELSGDRLPQFRSQAYAVSVERRSGAPED